MQKNYTSIGLMSGTSGDGVDASIIYSDGVNEFKEIEDKYFEYDSAVYKNIHSLKEKISTFEGIYLTKFFFQSCFLQCKLFFLESMLISR